ncbi:MAG: hypothetical protein KGL19_09125 [Bacteroidota bacterium]|nr:hypothetical protein [Bacteroidota bacterium]
MFFKKGVHFLVKGLLIPCLYVAFFFVQLFFNFDFSASQKNSSQTHVYQNVKGQQAEQYAVQLNKTTSAQTNIRLNKRFEPSNFPDFNFPDVDLFIKYYTQVLIGHNYQESLITTFTLTSSLRGPPCII